jgi:hypothetical protein
MQEFAFALAHRIQARSASISFSGQQLMPTFPCLSIFPEMTRLVKKKDNKKAPDQGEKL